MLEADDVVVVQTSVDLNLTHQLLFGSRLRECRFVDDLGGAHSLVLQVHELKAAGETSLSEEFALQVTLDANLAVVLDDLLVDEGLRVVYSLLLVRRHSGSILAIKL